MITLINAVGLIIVAFASAALGYFTTAIIDDAVTKKR
jgi:hypothetical protein